MRPNTWQCKRFEWRSETSRPDNWQISVRPPETKICIEPREDQFTARQNQRLFGPGKISTRSWQIQNPTLYKKSTKQQISYLTVLSPPPPQKSWRWKKEYCRFTIFSNWCAWKQWKRRSKRRRMLEPLLPTIPPHGTIQARLPQPFQHYSWLGQPHSNSLRSHCYRKTDGMPISDV